MSVSISKSVSYSFSIPLELSIQMEECMENTGFNRSELIKIALIEYIKSLKEKNNYQKTVKDIYDVVLEIKKMMVD
jgi:metal-responsive CopG/Arc/MetJ family transcriptional regulator